MKTKFNNSLKVLLLGCFLGKTFSLYILLWNFNLHFLRTQQQKNRQPNNFCKINTKFHVLVKLLDIIWNEEQIFHFNSYQSQVKK